MERSENNSIMGTFTGDNHMEKIRGVAFNGLGREDEQNSAIRQSYNKHLGKLDQRFDQILKDIKEMKERPEAFKQHTLPLARIKKIMKSDEDVKVLKIN